MAVSKGVPAGRLRDALALGLIDLGENRVQEAEGKVGFLAGARWHMVGRLQSNKAARAVALFDEIHSVDSLELAERLARLAAGRVGGRLPVYIQLNVDADAAKTGFSPAALGASIGRLAALDGLELRGLMTIGRIGVPEAESRATFSRLRELSDRLRAAEPRLGAGLSMGMSDDFELAVEEGATVVRIGRTLFGARPG
ncbi:YggS family pyridoxal phosphate-dependent enzyme [soil metagenome]